MHREYMRLKDQIMESGSYKGLERDLKKVFWPIEHSLNAVIGELFFPGFKEHELWAMQYTDLVDPIRKVPTKEVFSGLDEGCSEPNIFAEILNESSSRT